MSAFHALMRRVARTHSDQIFTAEVDPSWLQGRTTFGGLSSALVFEAMRQCVPEDRSLRALSVSFVGPVVAGTHEIHLRKLREGGSVSHLQGELAREGEINLSALAAFGCARDASVSLAGPVMPDVPTPESCEELPFIEGLTPDFTQHFDMRFSHGAPPLSGADDPDFGMWLRFREPTRIDSAALIALADVPPMPGLNMIQAPGVGSSLTWYLEFSARIPDLGERSWLYFDYRCLAAGDSYYNTYATIWSENGDALMFSRQIAMVFEK